MKRLIIALALIGAMWIPSRAQITGGGSASVPSTLLSTQTASASATLDFVSVITSTYTIYEAQFENVVPQTSGDVFWMRVSTNNGSTYDTSANYSDAEFFFNNGASATGGTASGGTKIVLTGAGIDNTANKGGVNGYVRFVPSTGATFTNVYGMNSWVNNVGPVKDLEITRGSYDAVTAVTAVRFLFSTGQITSGVIRLYGIPKS